MTFRQINRHCQLPPLMLLLHYTLVGSNTTTNLYDIVACFWARAVLNDGWRCDFFTCPDSIYKHDDILEHMLGWVLYQPYTHTHTLYYYLHYKMRRNEDDTWSNDIIFLQQPTNWHNILVCCNNNIHSTIYILYKLHFWKSAERTAAEGLLKKLSADHRLIILAQNLIDARHI